MAAVAPLPPARGRLVLDTGGLLAWAYDNPRVREIILEAGRREAIVVVPTVVIARAIRDGAADAPINLVLKRVGEFAPIAPSLARQAGALLGATRTTDVVDALVVAEALRALPSVIVTSDPNDIRLLVGSDRAHPRVQVVPV